MTVIHTHRHTHTVFLKWSPTLCQDASAFEEQEGGKVRRDSRGPASRWRPAYRWSRDSRGPASRRRPAHRWYRDSRGPASRWRPACRWSTQEGLERSAREQRNAGLPFKSHRAQLVIPWKSFESDPLAIRPVLIPCFIVLWFPFWLFNFRGWWWIGDFQRRTHPCWHFPQSPWMRGYF